MSSHKSWMVTVKSSIYSSGDVDFFYLGVYGTFPLSLLFHVSAFSWSIHWNEIVTLASLKLLFIYIQSLLSFDHPLKTILSICQQELLFWALNSFFSAVSHFGGPVPSQWCMRSYIYFSVIFLKSSCCGMDRFIFRPWLCKSLAVLLWVNYLE